MGDVARYGPTMVVAQRQLGSHVTVLFGHEQGKYPDGNSVLVRGRVAAALIDPALSVRNAVPAIRVDTVLLTHTHEDHAAGLSAVEAGEICVHVADLAALRSVDDLMRLYGVPEDVWPQMTQLVQERFHFEGWPQARGLTDGQTFDLGDVSVRAIHAPGHTSGHTVYLVESVDGTRVVVTGDIDLTTFGPYYGDASSSLEAFEATLTMMRGLEADHYVTFHHKGVIDGHAAFAAAVDQYIAVFGRRRQALLDLLATPSNFAELVGRGIVYRAGTRPPLFGDSVERYSIRRHLDRLLSDGAAATDGGQYWRT
jgi:glyoxylase-like metal-dependent hydrolase (beta-lactamase superfamily II)